MQGGGGGVKVHTYWDEKFLPDFYLDFYQLSWLVHMTIKKNVLRARAWLRV